MRVQIINSLADLLEFRAEISNLAKGAAEPNVFYEPWMLFPAIARLKPQDEVVDYILVWEGRKLCGFIPLKLVQRYHGLPLPYYTCWRYIHCFLCTPLIRANFEREVLNALILWLGTQGKARFLQFPTQNKDGLVMQSLQEMVESLRLSTSEIELGQRALLERTVGSEEYFKHVVPKKRLKEFRRQNNRLAELGTLSMREITETDDINFWIESFLAIEKSGWKGREGTALASSNNEEMFFREIVSEAFADKKLIMQMMLMDQRPIAMKCSFISGDGAFAFKIAFDEEYGRFSPGVLLELENVKSILNRGDIEWMDSCADQNHEMIERLWQSRRSMITVNVGIRNFVGNAAVVAIPYARKLYQKFFTRSVSYAKLNEAKP